MTETVERYTIKFLWVTPEIKCAGEKNPKVSKRKMDIFLAKEREIK